MNKSFKDSNPSGANEKAKRPKERRNLSADAHEKPMRRAKRFSLALHGQGDSERERSGYSRRQIAPPLVPVTRT
jgi:hypothetical protein